ncbi:hypothetical protein [Streptomyces sp. NPDC087294]|uniref:hypothetical protein n=1 Tax=Streptomyces sp. NPDC087294 TaxID=3365777 RepID=UPI0037F25C20
MRDRTVSGLIADGQHSQVDKDDTAANVRNGAWNEQVGLWGGSVVGSLTSIAMTPFTGPTGVVAGGLAGTASGQIFNGILDGFDGDGSEEKEQVYKNVKRMDQVEHSAILTTQESAKAATGNDAAASRAGDQAGNGLADAADLVEKSKAAL